MSSRPGGRRRWIAAALSALSLHGCAGIGGPGVVPLRGQDAAAVERDRAECRERAADETDSPVSEGLRAKVLPMLGGALLGAVLGLSTLDSDGGRSSTETKAVVVGAFTALGLLVGSVIGTLAGVREAAGAAQAREHAFARCLRERGYHLR